MKLEQKGYCIFNIQKCRYETVFREDNDEIDQQICTNCLLSEANGNKVELRFKS